MLRPAQDGDTIWSRIRQQVARRPVAAFLLILYPVSWLLFLPAILGRSGLGIIPLDVPAQVGVLLTTILGLTGVAFLVTRLAGGKSASAALLRHYRHFRTGPQWYLLAVLAAPALLLLTAFMVHRDGALKPILRHASQVPATYLLNVVLIAVLISLWEEGAWMAFMTERLQRRVGPVLASVLVAPCFGFLHFPLFLVTGGLIDAGRPHGLQVLEYAFYLLILYSVPVRIAITWVFNATGGSLPVVALLHASFDTTASSAVLTAFFPAEDGRLLYVAIAVVASLIVVATSGRLGYRAEPMDPGSAAGHAPLARADR